MTIQTATPDDLDTLRDLLKITDLPHDDLTPAHLEDFLLARDGDALCGTVGLEPKGETGLLRSLAVAEEWRGQGLGSRLVEAIERHAQQDGVSTLYLLTTTAAGYFEGFGYERMDRDALPASIQETEEATRLCPSSATCMRKDLSTATDAQLPVE